MDLVRRQGRGIGSNTLLSGVPVRRRRLQQRTMRSMQQNVRTSGLLFQLAANCDTDLLVNLRSTYFGSFPSFCTVSCATASPSELLAPAKTDRQHVSTQQ